MKLINILPLIPVVALVLNGCNAPQSETTVEEQAAVVVRVTPLVKTKISRTIDYTATISPFEEVNVVPSSPGRIEKIYVEAGDRVNKGDNLFLMDRTQVQQLKLQLAGLEKDLWRLDTLLKTGGARQQQYDQLKTQYDVTKTNLEYLEQNTLLKAPFKGIISGKYYENGELYTGTPSMSGKPAVVTLVQIDPVKVTVNISEQYYPLVYKGMKASISVDVFKNQTFNGTVYRISPSINPVTRSFGVEIEVPNSGELLKPGMFARVSMNLGEVETFVVPASTVLMQEGTNKRYVMVADNGFAKKVDVTIGKRFDDNLEVISEELDNGTLLISEGQSRLSGGEKIEIVN